jgi:HK97 gp10 family phage protein
VRTRTAGRLKKLPAIVENRAVVAGHVIGAEGSTLAAELAPKDTGFLSKNQTYSVEVLTGLKVEIRVGNNVPYGQHQELGTKIMKAQPYLSPTAQAMRKWAAKVMGKAVIRGEV